MGKRIMDSFDNFQKSVYSLFIGKKKPSEQAGSWAVAHITAALDNVSRNSIPQPIKGRKSPAKGSGPCSFQET